MSTPVLDTLNTEKIEQGRIYECDNRFPGDPYSTGYFIPVYVGQVGKEQTTDVHFEKGRCFENI